MSIQPPADFRQLVAEVFPVGTSGRLARALEVTPRVAQRWIAGDISPPDRAWEFLREQWEIMDAVNPLGSVYALVSEWEKTNAHPEVIGSYIAQIYFEVMGRHLE
ncbi:hypothetical protein [Devosia sp. A449]